MVEAGRIEKPRPSPQRHHLGSAAASPRSRAPLIQSRMVWYSGEVPARTGRRRRGPSWSGRSGPRPPRRLPRSACPGAGCRRGWPGSRRAGRRGSWRGRRRATSVPSLPGGTILRIVCERWQPTQFWPSSPIALKIGRTFASKKARSSRSAAAPDAARPAARGAAAAVAISFWRGLSDAGELAQALLDRRVGHQRRVRPGSPASAFSRTPPCRRRPARCSRRRPAAGRPRASVLSAAIAPSRAIAVRRAPGLRAPGASACPAARPGFVSASRIAATRAGDVGVGQGRRRSPRGPAARPAAPGTRPGPAAPRRGPSGVASLSRDADRRRAVGRRLRAGPSRPTDAERGRLRLGDGAGQQLVDHRGQRRARPGRA